MAFHDLAAKLAGDARVRGRQLERLCRWYLQNAPEYRTKIKRVWLWQDWPERWGADAGIDLVAETHDGELWAVQAKAYDPAYSITKSDVDTFLSESSRPQFAYRLLIATTDGIGANAYRTLADQEKPVGLALRTHLDAAAVEWPPDFDSLLPARPHPKTPRPHQQEAIDALKLGFMDAERGQLIMACGTGKTLVAQWAAEGLGPARTLVLVPSLTLLSQTLREWTANSRESFDYLAVCSDSTVDERDAMVSRTADLGLPVTTDAAAIEHFLRRDGRSVIFATYQSSQRIAEAQASGAPEFDLVIADEAHRCTGPASGDFASVLDANKIRARRRLFMTATPRYFTDRVKKVAGEAEYEVASMDDQASFGRVFHQLTFGEAIERDLLSDYQVLIVGVDDETCAAYVQRGAFVTLDGKHVTDARTLAAHIAVAKAMKKYDLKKTITFHGRVNKAQGFSSMFPSVVAAMPEDERPSGKFWSRHVSGKMPTSQRDQLLQRFRRLDEDHRGLLANARCLAEGVDVPAIDGVAFIDPRSSTVDVVQAVGRAIRKAEDKTHGTIVLPVFLRRDGDVNATLADSSFRAVWQVLSALRAHDNVLGEELDALRRGIGRDRSAAIRRPAKIVLDVPARVGPNFFRAFDVRLVEQSSARWEEVCGLLEAFVQRNGHARVPQSHVEQEYPLGTWRAHQIQFYRAGVLADGRRRFLESQPGWSWDPHEAKWEAQFAALKRLTLQRGAPTSSQIHRDESGFAPGVFMNNQRRLHKQGKLDKRRVELLESLPGWSWSPFDTQWETAIRVTREYAHNHGNLFVVKSYVSEDGFPLGKWLGVKRAHHNQGTLQRDRVEELTQLGMIWDLKQFRWECRFQELCEHLTRDGTVPRQARSPLGNWASVQRKLHLRRKLSPDRVARLEALPGWVWAKSASSAERRSS